MGLGPLLDILSGGQAGGVLERDSAFPPEARGGRWPCPKRCPSHRAGSRRRCTEWGVGLTAGHGPLVGTPGREASWSLAGEESLAVFWTTVMTPLAKMLSSNGQQARGQPGESPHYPREGALPGPQWPSRPPGLLCLLLSIASAGWGVGAETPPGRMVGGWDGPRRG